VPFAKNLEDLSAIAMSEKSSTLVLMLSLSFFVFRLLLFMLLTLLMVRWK
jgi:hypothetical protein